MEILLVDRELMLLEEQYIDPTKIEIVANKYSFVWKKTVDKNKAEGEDEEHTLTDRLNQLIL